eukprot:TRINITY_DN3225_c0_g1_i2.p1 TRINITY_DN3225_c0_g1~~TRINITY_DN3225_c0_g1_i2.p1  ORF type:complete len:522 (-),score=52.22 TRINITY_DN3225_c0_g1_i2:20-1585(-)
MILRHRLTQKTRNFFQYWANYAFACDLRSIALARVLAALITLLDIYLRFLVRDTIYGETGWMPCSASRRMLKSRNWHSLAITPHIWFCELPLVNEILMLINFVAAFCMLIGYRTRTSTIVTYILLTSNNHRNYLVNNGGETVFRNILFFLMFLPTDAFFAVDNLKEKNSPWWWDVRGTSTFGQEPSSEDIEEGGKKKSYRNDIFESIRVFSPATFGIVHQFLVMYWFAACHKTGEPWHNGTALWRILWLELYTGAGFNIIMRSSIWICEFFTYLTMLTERGLPILMMIPIKNDKLRALLRGFNVFTVFTLHFMFWVALPRIGLFGFHPTTGVMVLLPSLVWDFLASRVPESFKNQMKKRFSYANYNKKKRTRKVKKDRANSFLHRKKIKPLANIFVKAFIIYYIIGVFSWNMKDMDAPYSSLGYPKSFRTIGKLTGVAQKWSLFAPGPPSVDSWYVMKAVTVNGTELDLYNPRQNYQLTWEKPQPSSSMFDLICIIFVGSIDNFDCFIAIAMLIFVLSMKL